MQQRHDALGQPLMRIPGLPDHRAAELFKMRHIPVLENVLPDNRITESARIQQEQESTHPEEQKPKSQENAALGSPPLLGHQKLLSKAQGRCRADFSKSSMRIILEKLLHFGK